MDKYSYKYDKVNHVFNIMDNEEKRGIALILIGDVMAEFLKKAMSKVNAGEKNERMEAALEVISAWGNVYPLAVFPEPDFEKAARLLEAGGMTIDSVSASIIRRTIEGVVKIARDGLDEDDEQAIDLRMRM